jgi:hypothetical protein
MKYKLFKTLKGKKIHLSFDHGIEGFYSPVCGASTSNSGSYGFKSIPFKSSLCKNCFKGFAPESWGITVNPINEQDQ